jgi:hypothetical protein
MKLSSAANLISRLFHRVLIFPLALILLFSAQNAWIGLIFTLSFSFGLPFLYFLHLFARRKISDFDVSDRKQRYPLYAASLVGMLISLIFLKATQPTPLFYEFLRLFCLALTLVCINFKIKVSIHTASTLLLAILLFEFYGWSPWLFIIVPLVGTSRLILKRHSWMEVGLGILIPLIFYVSSLVPAFAR